MPRLTLLQWLAVALIQFFIALIIVAATHDYTLRQCERQAATVGGTASGPASGQAPPARITPQALLEAGPEVLREHASALFVEQRFDEAAVLYRRILALDPEDVDTYNDLGLALFYLGEHEEAVGFLTRARGMDASHQRLALTLGFVQFQLGQTDEARAILEQARDLGPGNAIGREAERLLGVLAENQ